MFSRTQHCEGAPPSRGGRPWRGSTTGGGEIERGRGCGGAGGAVLRASSRQRWGLEGFGADEGLSASPWEGQVQREAFEARRHGGRAARASAARLAARASNENKASAHSSAHTPHRASQSRSRPVRAPLALHPALLLRGRDAWEGSAPIHNLDDFGDQLKISGIKV